MKIHYKEGWVILRFVFTSGGERLWPKALAGWRGDQCRVAFCWEQTTHEKQLNNSTSAHIKVLTKTAQAFICTSTVCIFVFQLHCLLWQHYVWLLHLPTATAPSAIKKHPNQKRDVHGVWTSLFLQSTSIFFSLEQWMVAFVIIEGAAGMPKYYQPYLGTT